MQYDVAHKKMDRKINAKYTLEGTVPKNVDKIKYVGVTVTEDLRWKTHVSNICTKASSEHLISLVEIYTPVPKM